MSKSSTARSKPTDTGEVVSGFLEKNFTDYISDTFTAGMEDKLDAIARGENSNIKTLKDFYGPFLKEVKEKSKSSAKITDLGPAPAEFKCPICGSPMILKLSRYRQIHELFAFSGLHRCAHGRRKHFGKRKNDRNVS